MKSPNKRARRVNYFWKRAVLAVVGQSRAPHPHCCKLKSQDYAIPQNLFLFFYRSQRIEIRNFANKKSVPLSASQGPVNRDLLSFQFFARLHEHADSTQHQRFSLTPVIASTAPRNSRFMIIDMIRCHISTRLVGLPSETSP